MLQQHQSGVVVLWVGVTEICVQFTNDFLPGPRTLCNACGLVYAKLVSSYTSVF